MNAASDVVRRIDSPQGMKCDGHHVPRAAPGMRRVQPNARRAFLFVVALLWAWTLTASQPLPDISRFPILMVHGSGLESSYWRELTRALVADGYPREYLKTIDMLPRNGSNTRAAEHYVRPAVDELLEAARRESQRTGRRAPGKVILISHSMGAVSTRWYIARIAPGRVAGWVGIAPANHGTNALCGYSGAGDRELCPAFARSESQSRVQFILNGAPGSTVDETPFGLGPDANQKMRVKADRRRSLTYWTLRISPDRWITPADSAVLDGAGGLQLRLPQDLPMRATSPGNYLLGVDVDHDNLPADARVVRWVIEVVRAMNQKAVVPAT